MATNPNAAFINKIRNAALPFTPLAQLLEEGNCLSCGNKDIDLGPYPFFKSTLFLRALLFRCDSCGYCWTPKLSFDLSLYYKQAYANEVQRFRESDDFYNSDNPFWESRAAGIYAQRAERHISKIYEYVHPKSVLDFGAGIGLTLSKLDCEIKHAIEPDAHAQNILKGIGVEIAELDDEYTYDLIISSHSLEHLENSAVRNVLTKLKSKLNEDGVLLIEVPPGAAQIKEMASGPVNTRGRLEPHTLFFSSISLSKILSSVGFKLVEISLCEWTREYMVQKGTAPGSCFPGVRTFRSVPVVAIAK